MLAAGTGWKLFGFFLFIYFFFLGGGGGLFSFNGVLPGNETVIFFIFL